MATVTLDARAMLTTAVPLTTVVPMFINLFIATDALIGSQWWPYVPRGVLSRKADVLIIIGMIMLKLSS